MNKFEEMHKYVKKEIEVSVDGDTFEKGGRLF
jgi:hypothetical protein